MPTEKNELMQAVQDTVGEIQDILAKSGQFEEEPPMDAPPEEQPPAPEEAPMDAPPEEAPMDAPPEEAPPEGGDETEEMRAHAAELSDEELQMMLEILQGEMESRQAAPAPEEQPPAPAPEQPAPDSLEQSMKTEYAGLMKSVASQIEGLTKAVADLQKRPKQRVVTRAAATNSNQQVLEKSQQAKPIERLSKSETVDFLVNEVRARNPLVDREVISEVTLARSPEELAEFQDKMTKKGIKFPSL